jgi:hypothetical protein
MTDLKYGRIFTEDDVRQIVNAAVYAGIELAETGDEEDTRDFHGDAIYDAVVSGLNLKFPEHEPLFVLRGQDSTATATLSSYRWACVEAGSPQSHIDAIDAVIESFTNWQAKHEPKVPD